MADHWKKQIISVKVGDYSETGWLLSITVGKIWHTIRNVREVSGVLANMMKEIDAAKRGILSLYFNLFIFRIKTTKHGQYTKHALIQIMKYD